MIIALFFLFFYFFFFFFYYFRTQCEPPFYLRSHVQYMRYTNFRNLYKHISKILKILIKIAGSIAILIAYKIPN